MGPAAHSSMSQHLPTPHPHTDNHALTRPHTGVRPRPRHPATQSRTPPFCHTYLSSSSTPHGKGSRQARWEGSSLSKRLPPRNFRKPPSSKTGSHCSGARSIVPARRAAAGPQGRKCACTCVFYVLTTGFGLAFPDVDV